MTRRPEPVFPPVRSHIPTLLPTLLAGVVAGALGLGVWGAAPVAEAAVLNRIVLRVNDRIATLQDYESRRSQLVGELLQQGLPPEERNQQIEQLGERVFSDIYEELLLLSRADQLDIRITDNQLSAVLDQMQEQMGIPDRQALRAAVEQSGLEFDEFKEQWRSQVRMREVITREVEAPIHEELKEEELRRYYRNHPDEFRVPEQYQLREVVVLEESPLSDRERRRLALALREELEAGRPMDEVVTSHAEAGVTSKVIDLGWVREDELSPELQQAVDGLEPGSVTDPVAARGGLHVCVIDDYKAPSLQSFDEVAGLILRNERRRLRDERVPEYMEGLEKISYIRMDPPPGAQGFELYRGSVAEELPELPEEGGETGAAGEEPDPETEAAIRETDKAFEEVTVEVPTGPAPGEEDEEDEGDENGDEASEETPENEPPPGSSP